MLRRSTHLRLLNSRCRVHHGILKWTVTHRIHYQTQPYQYLSQSNSHLSPFNHQFSHSRNHSHKHKQHPAQSKPACQPHHNQPLQHHHPSSVNQQATTLQWTHHHHSLKWNQKWNQRWRRRTNTPRSSAHPWTQHMCPIKKCLSNLSEGRCECALLPSRHP